MGGATREQDMKRKMQKKGLPALKHVGEKSQSASWIQASAPMPAADPFLFLAPKLPCTLGVLGEEVEDVLFM